MRLYACIHTDLVIFLKLPLHYFLGFSYYLCFYDYIAFLFLNNSVSFMSLSFFAGPDVHCNKRLTVKVTYVSANSSPLFLFDTTSKKAKKLAGLAICYCFHRSTPTSHLCSNCHKLNTMK